MLRDVLTNKWVVGTIGMLCIIVLCNYLWYQYNITTYPQELGDMTEAILKTEPFKKNGSIQTSDQLDRSESISDSNTEPKQMPSDMHTVVDGPDVSIPLYKSNGQNSSNPLFADGVPEHLRCPLELIGKYVVDVSEEDIQKLKPIWYEIIEKYNPNRPIGEVWRQYIELENYYRGNADPEKIINSTGAGRLDWGHQNALDFPEILVLANEDTDRSTEMWLVDIGEIDPDWNLHILPDGRKFRLAPDFYYEFVTVMVDENGNSYGSTIRRGLSGSNVERVRIVVNETSDRELERLGGWNYNINPYTTGIYQLGDN